MKLRLILVTVVLVGGSGGSSHAATIRVPQDYALIQQACDAAQSGDTILLGALHDTMFVEGVTVSAKSLVIRSVAGPLKTQLRRSLIFQSSGSEDTTKIIGIRWNTGAYTPVLQLQDGRFVVDNCVFDSSNRCADVPAYTIDVGWDADVRVIRCTFVAQPRALKSSIKFPGQRSSVRVSGCVFTGSCDYALYPDGGYLSAEYCCFWQNAVDADSSVDWGAGNMPFDPLLRRPDFALQPGSPCLDAGALDLPPDPDGSKADIGAYIPYRTPATLYVSTTGSDDSGSGSLASPFRSVGTAYVCSIPEDTILLLPGTHQGHLSLEHTLVLTSLGGADVTTLQATATGWPVISFPAGQANHSTISDLTIAGARNASGIQVRDGANPRLEFCTVAGHSTSTGGGLYVNSDHVTVYACRFLNNSATGVGGGIYAVAADSIVIDSCLFQGNSSGGAGSAIVLRNCRHVAVTRNLAHGNSNSGNGGGPVSMEGTRQAVVRNNTVSDNANLNFDALGAGIVVANCTTLYLQNNLVSYNQGRYGIAVQGGPVGIYNEYNNVYGQWAPGIYGLTPGPGFIEADPLYDQNYELMEGSPCIDAGDPAMPVPPGGGSRIDIGAFEYQQTVAVSDSASGRLPGQFALEQNYPNPFNASTQIAYVQPRGAHVTLTIHDMLGRLVMTLVDEKRSAGRHIVMWNGRAVDGREVGSGVYFFCLRAAGETDARKLLILK